MEWQFQANEIQTKLLHFHEVSGEEWMLHVEQKCWMTHAFRHWLDHSYEEYMKELAEPSFNVPRYRHDQEHDARAVQEYAREAKLKEIVFVFWLSYNTLKDYLKLKEARSRAGSVSAPA
jgi:hypothetical protein